MYSVTSQLHNKPKIPAPFFFSYNEIKSVMGLTFAKSKKLQSLDMSNNKIGKLKAQLFNKGQTR